jgi:DNA-binding beta-propeller fold protein YncE
MRLYLLAAVNFLVFTSAHAQMAAVPELPYRAVSDFFKLPNDWHPGEVSGVALNSKGHIFVFQRARPMLSEFNASGNFIREIGAGLFAHPHGLRIDSDDNIWTTDDGDHLVLKLSPEGRVLLVLGRRGTAAEADWLFNQPTDIAFARDGDFYVSDGYGNSRVMKFDHDGRFLKSWGRYGTGQGEFNLPHSIVVDEARRVYVADRENQRIQIFDSDGQFLKQWTGIGYPYGLFITPDQHIWIADGGYDQIVELDPNGKILGAIGEPGQQPDNSRGRISSPSAQTKSFTSPTFLTGASTSSFQLVMLPECRNTSPQDENSGDRFQATAGRIIKAIYQRRKSNRLCPLASNLYSNFEVRRCALGVLLRLRFLSIICRA